jgi:hypothetical protein
VVGKGRLEGMGIRKNDCKGVMGEGAGCYQEGDWDRRPAIHVFFSGSFIKGSHVALF